MAPHAQRLRAAEIRDPPVHEETRQNDVVGDVYRRIGREIREKMRELTVSGHGGTGCVQLSAGRRALKIPRLIGA